MAKRHATPATPEVAAPAVVATPEAPALPPSRSIVPVGYREKCVKDRANRTAGGNVSVDSGDALAVFLRGKTVEQIAAICEAAGVGGAAALMERYARLNKGQQRMNLGNRLRTAIKDGTWKLPVAEKV